MRVFRLAVLLAAIISMAPLAAQTQRSSAIESYNRGMELFESDFILEAIRQFQEAVTLNPNFSDAYREIARSFYYLDEYDEAEAYIQTALSLAPTDTRSRTLYGRILLTRGQIQDAESIFRSVLADEPFNSDARVGLGEMSLARGDIITAGDFYANSLSLDPGDRRVLLALAFISQERGQLSVARDYIERALQADSQNPWVHYYAADFYFAVGEYELARFHSLTAINLRPDFYPALELLSRILVEEGEFESAISVLDQLDFTRLREPVLMYYTKALAEYQSGDGEAAILSLQRSLRSNPDDEISRLLMEEIILFLYELDFDHPMRMEYAGYHYDRASEFMQRNRFDAALYHLYRGLTLAPFSEQGRRLFASLLRERGEYSRYVNELSFISEQLMVDDLSISDDLEIYGDILRDSVPARWGVDQFVIEREMLEIGVYLVDGAGQSLHGDADRIIAKHLMDQLYVSNSVSFLTPPGVDELTYDVIRVSNGAAAFEHARRNEADYYILISSIEGEESLDVRAQLHLGRTGRRLRNFQVIRNGIGRVKDAVIEMGDQLIASLPLKGALINRNFERGLINLGYTDGLAVGDQLLIFKSRDLRLYTEDSIYDYEEDDVIGTASIVAVDFLISQIEISHVGFFDRVSRGDVIVPAPPPAEEGEAEAATLEPVPEPTPEPAPGLISELYDRIRGIR